jgi:hypothetical protein
MLPPGKHFIPPYGPVAEINRIKRNASATPPMRAPPERGGGSDLYRVVGSCSRHFRGEDIRATRNGSLAASVKHKHLQATVMTGESAGESRRTGAYDADVKSACQNI